LLRRQREIALAVGEPPPPRLSPFGVSLLPQWLKRAGSGSGGRANLRHITVLTEKVTTADPVADCGSRQFLMHNWFYPTVS